MFQNCSRPRTYDYLDQSSYQGQGSTTTTTSTTQPIDTLSCAMAATSAQVKQGGQVTWSVILSKPLAAGDQIYWMGSKSNIDGTNLINLGSTPGQLNYTMNYINTTQPGNYSFKAQIQSSGGAVICETNLVRVRFSQMCSLSAASVSFFSTQPAVLTLTASTPVNSAQIQSVNWYSSQNGAAAVKMTPHSSTSIFNSSFYLAVGSYKVYAQALSSDAQPQEVCITPDLMLSVN
jgi:hypothetical protein